MTRLTRRIHDWTLPVQVGWAVLAATWNFVGVWLIAQGARAPGPTASLAAGILLLVVGAGFVVSATRWRVVYLLLSALAVLMALAAVAIAFTADPARWPSEFWRYAGAVLNGVGGLASALAVVARLRTPRVPQR
jgi:hypothetical protein